ncbi:ankyrin repeat and IBR domain-containing protein 1-like [Coccinella septempunctata]|uniref:ankyrin repeat and IBR domain-containing protein 1-like n=1 Tax=Coccinella septempunctata TaxID=41139 RepID=UPI001D0952D1|nr:ankyrin repeat and IBR domain-containing protein 1-like [Coccinella septempunctata]XP_044747425.1 ankyrin repeat and IBR domain-containing protein 1-like [Coccinella septempunctata]XP_044747426.1 ankyrin repeat and IBR domain-containing protein 1-like [Coccinella septempunctata]XP_044747427.1 ankyrin repeat and IBR domain-containing protein 1-like [Coccinella septempunctata]
MGSTSSKFKKYLQHGDEYAAMQLYQSSLELRKNIDPNLSYGENHNHNTALHYAAKHGMKHLLRAFLNDLGGNPNKKNAMNETVLHAACQLNQTKSFSVQERKASCVQLLLYWKGVTLAGGQKEKVDLAAQDKDGNTALHWAASKGLKRCVELLLAHGAPLFIENNDKLTPCDLAMRGSHHDIARLLESRMVFADNTDTVNEDEIIQEQDEVYSGLRSQDLQEAKDQLLVDTSDMLKIPLFTAEALLRNNEWSRELLLEKWMKDPIECCELAGVQAPSNVLNHAGSFDSSVSTSDTTEEINEITCEICLSTITNTEQPVKMSCKHCFCKICWESYLTTKIQDGDAHNILCPAYQCHILVPVEFIEKLVSPDMARRYLQFDIKAFVESNKSIKWCPIPGCGRAVRLPEAEQMSRRSFSKTIPITSHAVDCGNSHFFCWECLGEAHAPCGCSQWQDWMMKTKEVKPEELKASCSGSEDAANFLWLVTNSKPCPNCKSPIQKNEGCNHIKCSKCKFDFCWVCQESWKRHSSATGGYFRCNRFESVHKADEKQCSLISEALDKNNQLQETSRFLHFYTRFKNHENSQKLEEPLLTSVKQKMEVLASSLGLKKGEDVGEKSTKFIEEGVRELLKARRVLCGSYVYGYYLVDDGYNKSIFEFMQNELEEVTEKLSEMIARSYLRTPKTMIVQTTALARRKRHEFVRAVAQGLIPPETPPHQRKRKRKHLDSDFTQTSVWLKDCEWPEYDSDDENELAHKHFNTRSSTPKDKDHQCGLLCTHSNCPQSDYNVEMIIALEMSRLQMIEDRMKQAQANTITPDPSSSISNNSNESVDDQLKLAIQLSLQDADLGRQCANSADGGNTSNYPKSNADFTVDYFLKSLANRSIDLKSLELDVDKLKSEASRGLFFRSCNGKEDGRFQISDIHENGFAFEDLDEYEDPDIRLKRSHSTGDLRIRRGGRGSRQGTNGEEPRYHLDSDHSSQHDEKPEELARKMLTLPSSSKNKQFLLLQQTYPEEELYQAQSSVEDTTISDSINADMEVCGIFNSNESKDFNDKVAEDEAKDNIDSDIENKENKKTDVEPTEHKKHSHNPFASIKAKFCSSHLPKTSYFSRAINKNLELLCDKKNLIDNDDSKITRKHSGESLSEKHSPKLRKLKKCDNQSSFSKSTGFLAETKRKTYKTSNHVLRIKICQDHKRCKALETDSSNEYESETGIPKSPTLFISGVSISRTPEPKSPGMSLISSGRQSRSSSLSVPLPINSCSLNISSSSLNNTQAETCTPSLVRSATPSSSKNNLEFSPNESPRKENGNSRSKSANEPEREREMFRFPKSSTDGALSSVLHVQESNLSSDDFHEALFLLERSPKTRDSKRKKKLKKKDKEEKKEDVTSAL